jgi:hypothetical protein
MESESSRPERIDRERMDRKAMRENWLVRLEHKNLGGWFLVIAAILSSPIWIGAIIYYAFFAGGKP